MRWGNSGARCSRACACCACGSVPLRRQIPTAQDPTHGGRSAFGHRYCHECKPPRRFNSRATTWARAPEWTLSRCFLVDAHRRLGGGSFGNTVPCCGAGSGPTMVCLSGGPCPDPSCATVTVVAADAMIKKATIAHFILTLPQAKWDAALAKLVRNPLATSPDDVSIRNAPHQVSVEGSRRISLNSSGKNRSSE
jgi:hypothetical protein